MKIYFYLNVCGLKSKLKFQEITDIIVSHDIIIFVETKLDDLDILNVPNGYSYITKNRKKMCKKSDGIVIIYKNKLENCLSFIQSESQFVQWVNISNVAFDLQNDIILGCVYVPPEGSKYSNSESFDEIEKELIALSKDSNIYSAIVGDFNAKTGTLNDFIIPDETRGGSRRGRTRRAPPPKIGKNMIFWRKIVIFHTKYPNNFRASLRNWKKYDSLS